MTQLFTYLNFQELTRELECYGHCTQKSLISPISFSSLRMEKIIANGWKGVGILSAVHECRNMNRESLRDPFAALSLQQIS